MWGAVSARPGPRRGKAAVGHISLVFFQRLAPNAGHPRRAWDFAIPATLGKESSDNQKRKKQQSGVQPIALFHRCTTGLSLASSTLKPPAIFCTIQGAGKRLIGTDYMSRKRLLQLLGALLCVPGAIAFFVLIDRGIDSPLIYLTATAMYVGFALALYESLADD